MGINRFYPDRQLTRLEYLKRGVLVLPILIGVILLSFLKYSYNIQEIFIAILIISVILMSYVLLSRFTTELQIDVQRRTLTIYFFTLLKNQGIELPMDSLSYTLKHAPTFRDSRYWSLNFYINNKKVYVLDNRHGYSHSVLQSVADELQRHQVMSKS